MFVEGVAVGHAGDVVAHRLRRPPAARLAGLPSPAVGQALRGLEEHLEQLADETLRLERHAVDLVVAVDPLVQEGAQGRELLRHPVGKGHQLSGRPHLGRVARRRPLEAAAGLRQEIGHQPVDQPAHRLVGEAFGLAAAAHFQHLARGGGREGDLEQLVDGEEAGAQTVVHVVAAIGDVVADGGDLRLQRRLHGEGEVLGQRMAGDHRRHPVAQRAVVLDHALQGLGGEVEAVEGGVAPFELGQDAEGLDIVVEAAEVAERLVEGRLAGVAEGRVAEIVGERDGLAEVLVEGERAADGARDLRHLEGVGEPGAEMVALEVDEYLGLVFEAAEGSRVDDAVAVPLMGRAESALRLPVGTAGAVLRPAGKARKLHPITAPRPWPPRRSL